jgi:hydrogenase expression/formation protein HypD
MIPQSGWGLRPEFAEFDAEQRFDLAGITAQESWLCIAGEILRGLKKPHECPAYAGRCTPQSPLGAPMVSAEGACAAYYRYHRELVPHGTA